MLSTGADPLAGGNAGGSSGGPGSSAPSHLANHQMLEAARHQQELVYRDILSRPPFSGDPMAAAHQVTGLDCHEQCALVTSHPL